MKELKGNWGQNLTPVFFHIFVEFMETEPCRKFDSVLNIFLRVMKFRSLERLDVSDVIPTNI